MVLSGLVAKAHTAGVQELHDMSQEALCLAPAGANTVTGVLGILGSGAVPGGSMRQAEGLLAMLFGPARMAITESIGTYSGLKPASAETLLLLLGAVLPALVAAHAASNGLDARGLATALVGLKEPLLKMLPKGQSALLALLNSEKKKDNAPSGSVLGLVRRGGAVLEWPGRLSPRLTAIAGIAASLAYALRLGEHNSATTNWWAIGVLPTVDPSIPLAAVEFAKLVNLAW